MLIEGHTEVDILEAVAELMPGKPGKPVMLAAIQSLQAMGKEHHRPEVIRPWAIEASKLLMRRLNEVGDYASALRAVKQVADLSGCTKPQKAPAARNITPSGELDAMLESV